jgi:hypothetical protein
MLLMQPSLSKFIKITPCSRATKLVNFQIISVMNYGTKFCRLKLLLPTILTSSLPFYPYQKDERALPGYLLTRFSFSPSDIKRLSLSPRCFLFSSTLILSFLTLSLSLAPKVIYPWVRRTQTKTSFIAYYNLRLVFSTNPVVAIL